MNKTKIKKIAKKSGFFAVIIFAIIGLGFVGVFFAMKLHLTDVKGSIDSRNEYFKQVKNEIIQKKNNTISVSPNSVSSLDARTTCHLLLLSSLMPENGSKIIDVYIQTKSSTVVQKMIIAAESILSNNTFWNEQVAECNDRSDLVSDTNLNKNVFDWTLSDEWNVLSEALIKDKDAINQASLASGVSSRFIVATVMAEQFRFFTANRESFKKFFEPLKVLGNATQFSYGVAGVKEDTARAIENHLKNPESPFYLGPTYEHLLDFTTTDVDQERLNRLTDKKNHYYSYLYTALFIKQINTQWQKAGYNISDRPEVLATIFNLGFGRSVPKENPEIGGSTITVRDKDYTFGGLSYEFYYSGELYDVFPY